MCFLHSCFVDKKTKREGRRENAFGKRKEANRRRGINKNKGKRDGQITLKENRYRNKPRRIEE